MESLDPSQLKNIHSKSQQFNPSIPDTNLLHPDMAFMNRSTPTKNDKFRRYSGSTEGSLVKSDRRKSLRDMKGSFAGSSMHNLRSKNRKKSGAGGSNNSIGSRKSSVAS